MSTLEDKIGEMSDAVDLSKSLVQDLDHDCDGELEVFTNKAVDIAGDLECAEVCETEEDFAANVKAALDKAVELQKQLKAHRTEGDAKEFIKEAKCTIKQLIRELTDNS